MRGADELIRIEDLTLPDGRSVRCRREFPKIVELIERVPLAFLAPSLRIDQAHMADLAAALRECGFATFSFELPSPELLTLATLCALYERALEDDRISRDHTVLIGLGEGADWFAHAYYNFHHVQPPFAIVMLSPTTHATLHDYNMITCPYFVVHGLDDPYFDEMPYDRLEDVVHHHQMRYGDSTTKLLIPDLGADLRGPDGRLAPRVIDEVINWLGHAAPRQQEREAG